MEENKTEEGHSSQELRSPHAWPPWEAGQALQLAARQHGPLKMKLRLWGDRGGRGGSGLAASSMGGTSRLRPRGSHGRGFLSSSSSTLEGGCDGDDGVDGAAGGEAARGLTFPGKHSRARMASGS